MEDPLSYFEDVKNVSAEIIRDQVLFLNGVEQPPVPSIIVTLDVIFYLGAQAENLVSEKIRQSVDAVLLTEPTTDIKLNDVVVINAGKRFIVISDEDVAEQGELLVIGLKRFD